jgi:probable rRNA maturation factor
MAVRISLQNSSTMRKKDIPTLANFKSWIKESLQNEIQDSEIVIRIVDEIEGKALNHTYRKKDYATNVLSFPYELTDTMVIGDLVLCGSVILQEAMEQKKDPLFHWAHLTVHGVLHLLGYDHMKEKDAKIMQKLEVKILKEIGFSDPY